MSEDQKSELLDKIICLFAFDGGATDSGIKDDNLKRELREREDILKLLMEALFTLDPEQGYTIEDAKNFVEWVEDEYGLDIDWI